MTVRRVNQSNKAAKLRGPECFLFLFSMEQRVRNASNDYRAAGRCRWGSFRREDGFGKCLWFTWGGGVVFLEKASTYAASQFLCRFVWSHSFLTHSFLHIEKRSQSISLFEEWESIFYRLLFGWLSIPSDFFNVVDFPPQCPPPQIITTLSNAK